MGDITVVNNPTRSELGAAFGHRQWDWTYKRAYSDLTPATVEECVNRVVNGLWQPVFVYNVLHLRAMHHLHDVSAEQNSAWCSGFIHHKARGRRNHYQRCQLWDSAREHITLVKGFAHIFCYCMANNTRAHQWVERECKFTWAGLMRRAVPEEGQQADIVLYSQDEADVRMCQRQARRMFPAGTLEDVPTTAEAVEALLDAPYPPME